ncbi:pilus assembly protein PilM [Cupriavidus respiraculi]|uniref:type IV pilus assembly protein PilM n=1 Tax=Cupriavidus respiraculi TaxID=195930 RepID=UPI001C96AAF2|nr:type IV pilus assembly protein PilM [Cupriavidus respiraculi]MBY4949924.1 pilus assembly protein PilM [Cupriavidus respiraculi]
MSGFLRRSTVGVDIGSSSIKVVELSVGGKRNDYRLEKCASELLDRNAVADGSVVNIEAVGTALRRALGKAGIRGRDVVLGVPSMLTESQTVSLPDNLSDDELYVQVESEAHRLFPPSQAVNFDYAVIGPNETEGGIGVRVTATNSERVQERVTVAEFAGLKAQVMDVEEYAVHRSVAQMLAVPEALSETDAKDLPVVAVIHLGGSRSKAIFYQGWKELYEQPLNSYGDQLTQSAARMFTLDVLKAEIKKRKNTLPDNWRAQLLKPSLEALGIEVQGAVRNFLASSSLGRVDEILLCGGHASLLGVQAAIEQHTGIATTLANPFANMATAGKVNARYLQRDLPAYIVGAGLALRGLQ